MPIINLENCTQCMKCVRDCPSSAIEISTGFIAETCIHCGHCVAICPESAIFPDKGSIVPLSETSITPAEFSSFTAGLRSTRYYLKKEVEKEKIELLLENMRHYASASNTRSLQITLVQSPEKIQLLNDLTADILLSSMKLITLPGIKTIIKTFAPSVNVEGLDTYRKSFEEKRRTNSSMICHHAPLVMLFHGPVSKYGMLEADANIWATQTSMYAKTLGLGSCFIGFIVKAAERSHTLRKEMRIPKHHKIYAALILGYPKVQYKNETSRLRPLSNVI
ncbi:MAG: nitroreductase family protein [Bacteroidales bacterium]|nr:nitroreductase family protein [Bacteroidales bacterium]